MKEMITNKPVERPPMTLEEMKALIFPQMHDVIRRPPSQKHRHEDGKVKARRKIQKRSQRINRPRA
jgi:hypothetical protein